MSLHNICPVCTPPPPSTPPGSRGQNQNSNMSFCFLASLATSWRIARTSAEVERLLRGMLSMSLTTEGRFCWDTVLWEGGGSSGVWLYCRDSRAWLPWG